MAEKRLYPQLRNTNEQTHLPLLFQAKRGKVAKKYKTSLLSAAREFSDNYDVALASRPATLQKGEEGAKNYPSFRGKKSGDYAWFHFRNGKGNAAIGFGDVMGHGLPAATFREKIMDRLTSTVQQPTKAVLEQIHELISQTQIQGTDTRKKMPPLTAAIHGEFDWRKGEIEAINAGHEPAFLLRDGKITRVFQQEYAPLGIPFEKVGASPEVYDYSKTEKLELQPGDRLFFISDGILLHGKKVEGEKSSRRISEEAIEKAIRNNVGGSLDKHVEKILAVVDEWGKERSDDQTIFALAVKKKLHGR